MSVDWTNESKLAPCQVTQLPEAASLWPLTIAIGAPVTQAWSGNWADHVFIIPPKNTPYLPDVSAVSRPWPGIRPQIGSGRCHLYKHSLAPAQPTCALVSPFAVHKAQWPLGLLGPVLLMRVALSPTQLYWTSANQEQTRISWQMYFRPVLGHS